MDTDSNKTDERILADFLDFLGTGPQTVSEHRWSHVAQAAERLCLEDPGGERDAPPNREDGDSGERLLPDLLVPGAKRATMSTVLDCMGPFALGAILYLVLPPFLARMLFP